MKDHHFSLTIIVVLLFVIAAHFVGLKALLTILAVGMGLVVLLAACVAVLSAWLKYRQNRRR